MKLSYCEVKQQIILDGENGNFDVLTNPIEVDDSFEDFMRSIGTTCLVTNFFERRKNKGLLKIR